MHREENCGCHEHGRHHRAHFEGRWGDYGPDCGCVAHGHHGMYGGWHHLGLCGCGCHQPHGGTGFHRRFISREEMIGNMEDYLKQLQAESKAVEERLAELKKAEK